MDIKEIGITSVVVIGGAVYGVSNYALSDVLTEDIKYVSEVPMAERQAYMDSVSAEFTEFYDGGVYGTDTFNFSGEFEYKNNPTRATFIEVVRAEQTLSPVQIKELRAYHADKWMCEDEDATIFTDKGWTYTTTIKNTDGKLMVSVACKPTSQLRQSYS